MDSLVLFGSIVFGAIATGYIWSGKRRGQTVVLGAGIGLAVVCYLVYLSPFFLILGLIMVLLPFILRG